MEEFRKSFGEYHIMTFEIDGLNLENEIFNHKNRICFAHPKGADDNIVCVNVFMDKPLTIGEGGRSWEPQNQQNSANAEEALRYVGLFLSCFALQNDYSLDIVFDTPSSRSFSNLTDLPKFITNPAGYHTWIKSNKPKKSVTESLNLLKNTVPLFETVQSVLDESRKGVYSLEVALLVYQKTAFQKEILNNFINLVTIIESLLTDKEDLSYKFAIRTTLLIESNKEDRRELYDFLREVYRNRSTLVHGSDTSMFAYKDYLRLKERLEPLTKQVLLKYIDLANKKMSKKDIMDYLDNIALGTV